jgi:hypothetical protein
MALGSTKKTDDTANADLTASTPEGGNRILESFDNRFASITMRSLALLGQARAFDPSNAFYYHIARSAAEIEKAFGGITARLWDDPFEWTLPEYLSTSAALADYIQTVDETRSRGLAYIKDDGQLFRLIQAPIELKPIFDVLLEAILRSEFELGAASALAGNPRHWQSADRT